MRPTTKVYLTCASFSAFVSPVIAGLLFTIAFFVIGLVIQGPDPLPTGGQLVGGFLVFAVVGVGATGLVGALFGVLVGFWLIRRVRASVSWRRCQWETVALGAGLGLAVPLVSISLFNAWHDDHTFFISLILNGLVTGAMTAFIVSRMLKRTLRHLE